MIWTNLFEKCCNFYGEEGHPPELPVAASEGATDEDPPPELGGEWLTEAERRDKRACTIKWQEKQHEIWQQQAKDCEKLDNDLSPFWPLDGNINKPHTAPASDGVSSIDLDNSSVDSDNSNLCCDYSEGATVETPLPPPSTSPRLPRCSQRLKKATPPRRSKRLRRDGESANLISHPD